WARRGSPGAENEKVCARRIAVAERALASAEPASAVPEAVQAIQEINAAPCVLRMCPDFSSSGPGPCPMTPRLRGGLALTQAAFFSRRVRGSLAMARARCGAGVAFRVGARVRSRLH